MTEKQILTISETVSRCKEAGYPISSYTLRRAIKSGSIPCRCVGRTYLIAWKNVLDWLMCADGQDNPPVETHNIGNIRRVEMNETKYIS